ncbi:ABC transporter permease [Microbacterium sp. RD1]|uniref:ABC transporter permease n=1 Tax=Microbacterium sp. RD1 TaxID=3457313 RepID=UPI003FA60EFA
MTTVSIPVPNRSRFRMPAFGPVLIATVALFVVCAFLVPQTVSALSLQTMVPYAAVLAIAAAGQTLVVQQRGIDLSVGGMISVAAIGVPILDSRVGIPPFLAIVIVLVFCGLVGALNGLLVSRLSITPLVATLAVNALLVGVVALITGGSTVTVAPEQVRLATTRILGLPALVWIAVVVVIVMAVLMARTAPGRRFVAAGANPAAARVSTVNVTRHLLLAYVFAGLSYAVAGVLLAGYLRNPGNTVGAPYLLTAIATVIVGGTALRGGKGTILGSAIAAVFLSQLVQTVLTLGAPSSTQMLIQAGAIAVAALLQGATQFTRRSRRGSPEPVQPAGHEKGESSSLEATRT